MADENTDITGSPPALAPLRLRIMAVTPKSSSDEVATMLDRVQFYKRAMQELADLMEQQALEWCDSNGDLVIGDIKYYSGFNKVTKCTDVRGAVEALMNAVGGDFEAFVQLLASQPIKHGAARKVEGFDWDAYFKTEERPELREGKPTKTLQRVDTKYLKG